MASAVLLPGFAAVTQPCQQRCASSQRRSSVRGAFVVRASTGSSEGRVAAAVVVATRRTFALTALTTLSTLFVKPNSASAYESRQSSSSSFSRVVAELSEASTPGALFDLAEAAPGAEIYFGNGCFWGRQHEFIEAERRQGRSDDEVSSLVGYAGGYSSKGADGKVCYYYGKQDTIYEKLGHGEVVRTVLSAGSSDAAVADLKEFAQVYFKNFKQTRGGMQRLDPQDSGPGYRNMIGLPGGMDSPLYSVIADQNVNGMKLVRGAGNKMSGDRASEEDVFNSVWVYDSTDLPFYPAEVYHQFHDGLGYKFPDEYTKGLKKNAVARGLVKETGCPEMRERSFANFESLGL